jgi:SAM-dependent methyltransferase
MPAKNEWQEFFDQHAPDYMKNPWTGATQAEVDFIRSELGLQPGERILDIGCGTGRHAVALAQRGFVVTGVDISAGMLNQARQAANIAGVLLTLIQADATSLPLRAGFDAAICLCEGAFGLLGMHDDPERHELDILAQMYSALKPGAGVLVTGPNGLAKIRQFNQADVDSGKFDPYYLLENLQMEWETLEGKRSVPVRERGYLPSQFVDLFRRTGFKVEHLWGGTAGHWGRRPVDLDEIEIMVVARKPTR